MSDWMETIRKENSPLLEKLDPKMKKRVKKTLQAAQPTEFFGQDFTKLGNLLETEVVLHLPREIGNIGAQ